MVFQIRPKTETYCASYVVSVTADRTDKKMAAISVFTNRLTHSASELSGYTCTSSLTMNSKFQYRTRLLPYWPRD